MGKILITLFTFLLLFWNNFSLNDPLCPYNYALNYPPCPSRMEIDTSSDEEESQRDYPIEVRISAVKNLKKLLKANENQYKHGFLSTAMTNTFCIKDKNRYYLLKRWINPFFAKHPTIKNWKQLTPEFLDSIIIVYENANQGQYTRYRIIHNPPTDDHARMDPCNAYCQPIMEKYLHFQDTKGYILNARSKFAV